MRFLILLCAVFPAFVHAQVREQPSSKPTSEPQQSSTNQPTTEIPKTTIYYDLDWHPTQFKEDAFYYREVRLQNGVPVGYVRDYYISGKLQWLGKLRQMDPDIPDGTCIWYYENGNKQKECIYTNGQLVSCQEWKDDGSVKVRTLKYVNTLPLTARGISSSFNRYAQRSRTVFSATLPQNTVYYIIRLSISRPNGTDEGRQRLFDLLSTFSSANPYTKAATALAGILTKSTCSEKTTYFVTDRRNSELFMTQDEVQNWFRGENVLEETIIGKEHDNGKLYICVDNHNYVDDIVASVEVVAVVEE